MKSIGVLFCLLTTALGCANATNHVVLTLQSGAGTQSIIVPATNSVTITIGPAQASQSQPPTCTAPPPPPSAPAPPPPQSPPPQSQPAPQFQTNIYIIPQYQYVPCPQPWPPQPCPQQYQQQQYQYAPPPQNYILYPPDIPQISMDNTDCEPPCPPQATTTYLIRPSYVVPTTYGYPRCEPPVRYQYYTPPPPRFRPCYRPWGH